jgi:predicted RNA-binding protein with PIN domain
MLYLVDGYNVTMADPATRTKPRETQRLELVRRLGARPDLLPTRGHVTVVFDGGRGAGDESSQPVTVRFSKDRSADDLIVSLATASDVPVTVVTSDRELQSRVKEHVKGAKVLLSSSVFDEARPAPRPRGGRSGGPGGSTAGLPKGANRITEELKDLWLPPDER